MGNGSAGKRYAAKLCLPLLLSLLVLSSCDWGALANNSNENSIPKQMRVHGVVTAADDASNLLIVQSESGGIKVEDPSQFPAVGQVVDIDGLYSASNTGHSLLRPTIHASPEKTVIEPAKIESAVLVSTENQFRKVQVTGIVRAFTRTGRLTLFLRTAQSDVLVKVVNDFGIQPEKLVDSEIQATGVLDLSYDASTQPVGAAVWVNVPSDLKTLLPAPAIDRIPSETVAQLRGIDSGSVPAHRIKLHGNLIEKPKSGQPRFEDRTGSIPVEQIPESVLENQLDTDLLGFLTFSEGRRQLSFPSIPEQSLRPEEVKAAGNSLRDAAVIHGLSASEAAKKYRVELDTTITFLDPSFGLIFVQDKGPGFYIDGQGVDFTPLRVGARVHLVGVTAPGDFAPMIVNPSFTVGDQRALPAPIAGKEEIFVGSLDSSRVQLEGVIKAVHIAREHTVFDLQHGTHAFEANIPFEVKDVDQLVHARVRVTGVAGTHFNSRRQFLGVFVFVPSMADIDILRRGPDPNTMPMRSVSALMQFAPGVDMDDPVKISGVVTYSNDSTVYVQDGSGGVAITARDHPPLSPSDVVEAIGYARPASFTAAIENGHLKKIGRAAQPQPINITAAEALAGNYDSQLIRIQGILIDRSLDASKQTFVLSAGRIIFRVYTDQLSALPGLKKGSVVSVTGVCSVEVQSTYGSILPKSFSVLLRSPRDVTVVRQPSWWSLEHTIELAGTLASFALVAIFWIGSLRRQVLLKTRALAERSNELMKAKDAAESASRLKSEFLANMSHEIRTPMNGVLGMTSLALGSEISSEVREYLTMANDSAKNLLTLLNDVLDLSKIEASRLTLEHIAFSVREVVTRAVRTLAVTAHEKGIELIIDVDAAVPDVLTGDPYRLHQVLLNLTGNAIKFTERGEVLVSVSVKEAEGQSVTVLFVVRDSGIGIAPEQQHSIFHSFTQGDGSTTRKFGGTGLGLSICRELVHLMNGEIGVDSIPGTGSSFWFTSTFILADAQPQIIRPADSEVLCGKRVLIVDDNQTNRALLNQVTQLWGMVPTVADNAHAALAASEAAALSGDSFYLYLVDVHMPGRDGFEFVRDLNRADLASDSAILMLSSVDLRNTAQRSKELGIDRYLLKPATAEELLEAVLLSVGNAAPRANNLPMRAPVPRTDARFAILLAEDNLVNQRLTKIILEKAGYRVTTVTNGIDAVEEIKSTIYDLVLMDVQMPDMDGYESVHKIRQWEATAGRHQVPVIAITAHAMDGHRERCLAAGMDAYISKPMNKEQLLAKVSELVAPVQADSSEPLVSP